MKEAKKYMRYKKLDKNIRSLIYKAGFLTAYREKTNDILEEVIKISENKYVKPENIKEFLNHEKITVVHYINKILINREPQIRIMTAYELVDFFRNTDNLFDFKIHSFTYFSYEFLSIMLLLNNKYKFPIIISKGCQAT